jgi:transposase
METREAITLDPRAQQRLLVLNHVLAGELSVREAAGYLRLSARSVRRLLARYHPDEGAAALVHGNRGRVPANRLDDEIRDRLVDLARTTYQDVNRAHLADLLAEREGIVVAERTLRRVLAEAGLPPARRRRPRGDRSRRERMPQAGMLLQVDGSQHDWLEGRGPRLTLVGGIDDATGLVTGAIFRDQEDTAGYLETLVQTARALGLPLGLYSDRHGIFWKGPQRVPTLAEQFAGRGSTTQLGLALEAAAIAWVAARSAEAKGRVERLWGTAQDRLVVELRLAGASTREEANLVLPGWIERHNARFAIAAADPDPVWRPLPDGLEPEALFCFRHGRRVARDGTLTLAGESLMLADRVEPRRLGRRLVVSERLDGSRWVEVDGAFHRVVPAPERPARLRRQPRPAGSVRAPGPPVHRPAPDHPWRRYSPYPYRGTKSLAD